MVTEIKAYNFEELPKPIQKQIIEEEIWRTLKEVVYEDKENSSILTKELYSAIEREVKKVMDNIEEKLYIFTEPGGDLDAINRGDLRIHPISQANPFGVQ